jgi:hypothetical protein
VVRDDPLFPTRTGRGLSDDAVEARIAIYKKTAGQRCLSLATLHADMTIKGDHHDHS